MRTFNKEQRTYKQMKLSPLKNPNFELKETTEQLVNLIGRHPVLVHDSEDHIIGTTIPGTAVIIDGFICGDIISYSEDLSLYKWSNAGMIIHPQYKTIIRYTNIEYRRTKEEEHVNIS